MEGIEKLQYEDELGANRFSSVFLSVMCITCVLIWLANEAGIFVVNRRYMRVGMAIACGNLFVPVAIFLTVGGTGRGFKYLVVSCISVAAISIETFLTFHGVMLCVFPLFIASQYTSTRMFLLAFLVNLAGILVAVPLGYYMGCWDGNMIYATTYGVTAANDSLARRAAVMNADYMSQLLLYFAMPRMITFSVIAFCLTYLLKAAKRQYARQNLMRLKAECDGLTRLGNRVRWERMAGGDYRSLQSVLVAFIDVNFLKRMNDVCGHDAGDAVLLRVADELRRLDGERVHAYRLGGDEFVLVFCDYPEDEARSLLAGWERGIGRISPDGAAVQCSLSVGCAYARRPFSLDAVVKEADDRMYEQKLAMKAMRTD